MRGKGFKAARRLGLAALLLAPAAPALFYAARARAQVRAGTAVKAKPQAPVQAAAPDVANVSSKSVQAAAATQVNFKQLAELARRARLSTAATLRAAPVPGTVIDTPPGASLSGSGADAPPAASAPAPLEDTAGPNVASPAPSQNFLAQEDAPKVGTVNGFTIPPDTNGAVGLDRVFTNTNANYRIHDKATGAPLSTVSADTFWAASGGSGFFDPQIVYDPYNQRWILAIASNAATANSSIIVAVSQTPDPAGSYNMYRYTVGCANGATGCAAGGEYADYPMLGFNKNWIAVGMNMFDFTSTNNNNDKTLVIDYPAARAGTSTATLFSGLAIGVCNYPVSTYSPTEETLYLVKHVSSGGANYRLSTVTGTPSAPAFALGATKTRPGGGWTQPGGDNLPQNCVNGVSLPTQVCPASVRGLDAGDSQVRSNPVFRNGRVWYAQTIALPSGGTVTSASRFVAQWTAVDASGNFVDGGRVEDATATLTNGGNHYAYPSLAVNKNNDVLMGFSNFESDDYVDAGYAFRLGTDAAGTMRDPVIYKEGEDYYEKVFSGTRNRWGDYSHTLVDPSNDRDLWTVEEYAQARVGTTGTGSNDSRWGTWWAKVTAPAGAGELLISEFRLRGAAGATDEYVELYNNNESALTVATADGSAGYAVAASAGGTRCTVPNGTVIPARGHFLCVNSSGYSLANYPAGNATTATGDATFTADIADNSGVAVFNTANAANFSAATRLDAAGFAAEADALYREGAGIPPVNPSVNADYAFYRDNCGKQGSVTTLGACPTGGFPSDTNDNAVDFVYVEPNGVNAGAGQRLGAPGPENLSSPVQRNAQASGFNLDPAVGSSQSPNRVRDFTTDIPNNSTFGTLLIRKTVQNNTGAPVTRLRFRVVDITTFPSGLVNNSYADLRARTSGVAPTAVSVTGANPACPANQCAVQQTTLEESAPGRQPNGGGFDSSLSVDTVTLANPVPPGGYVNVQFLLGVQRPGTFKFFVNVEVLP